MYTLLPAYGLLHAQIDVNIEPLEFIDLLEITHICTGLRFSASFLKLARRADLNQGFLLPAFDITTSKGVQPFIAVYNPSHLRLAAYVDSDRVSLVPLLPRTNSGEEIGVFENINALLARTWARISSSHLLPRLYPTI